MSKISLYSNIDQHVTTIPNTFLDEYMVKANGEFLKVYLFLLRSRQEADRELSVASIADTLNFTENDVKRALRYWRDEGLIKLSGITKKDDLKVVLNPITKHEQADTAEDDDSVDIIEDIAAEDTSSEKDIAAAQRSEEELSQLYQIFEGYMGKTITPVNTSDIDFLYNELGFSMDLCDYLFQYCVDSQKTSSAYMRKVAINWKEEGIDTVEKAKLQVKSRSEKYYSVLKAMGRSSHAPTEKEIRTLDSWYSRFGFGTDILILAGERAIAQNRNSLSYVEKILSNWHDAGYKTVEEIEEKDPENTSSQKNTKNKKNQFGGFSQRSYDFAELEKLLVNKPLKAVNN